MQIKSLYRTYDVVFDGYEKYLNDEKLFFIVDEKINDIYNIDFGDNVLYIQSIEEGKTFSNLWNVIDVLIRNGVRKDWKLVAVGGGIIQDVTGFISSILFRGIEWIFIPTTLLSQADSCIGSKTSINFYGYKNQIGTFWAPSKIIIDTRFLNTLSGSEINSGYGEILKYHILDNNLELLDNIKDEIEYCLNVKKKYIEEDEFDKDKRNLLNYGHCFGHALESVSDFTISHGEAVIIGMRLANQLALNRNLITKERYDMLEEFLKAMCPKFDVSELDVDYMIIYMMNDKKRIKDNMSVILPVSDCMFARYNDIVENEIRECISSYEGT